MKDLISASAEQGGIDLLNALTIFVNTVIHSDLPSVVSPIFFGANLTALKKRDGGLRPIAVGFTLRRLIAKCLCSKVLQSMADYLSPYQLGFDIPKGIEAAVHAARSYLNKAHLLLLKLDFKNAFNTLRRDKILLAVKNIAPLYPFCSQVIFQGF